MAGLAQRLPVCGPPAIGEDPAVDRGMERLDPAVEHLGEAGHGGHVGDRKAGLAKGPCRATGRDQLEALGDQPAREVDQVGLVGYRQQCPSRHGDPVGGERVIDPSAAGLERDRASQQER